MKVSEFLIKSLVKHKVSHIFGIPGDAINDLMEAVRKEEALEFVHVKHEEGGALAASIQAKLTGRLSVCVGTSGPGAIHLLNGLYDAKLDHTPVLAITGQVPTEYIGTDYHQEVDLERLFSDVSVYSQTLTNPKQLPHIIMEACRAAISHRGVAHISIPSDLAGKSINISMEDIKEAAFNKVTLPTSSECQEAVDLIAKSEKIAILAGIGAVEARDELLDFATQLQAPIVRTLRAKHVIDDHHPMCAGGIGLLGGKPAVWAFEQCDTLIMVGTDFPYHDFYPNQAKVIQIDIDERQIGKRHPVDVGLVGHAKHVLAQLNDKLDMRTNDDFLAQVQDKMETWRSSQANNEQADANPMKPQRLVKEISEAAPDDAIFVCDTGTVNAWTARHLRVNPSQLFTMSAALGTMGVAMPGAIGAKLAFPDRPVIAIAGDGGFAMTMTELSTAVRYQLPMTIVILNNQKLSFIALEQESKGLPAFGIDLHNPDFVAIAKACGADGERVESCEYISSALHHAAQAQGPYVIDVCVDPDELIFPPKIELSQALGFAKAKVIEWTG